MVRTVSQLFITRGDNIKVLFASSECKPFVKTGGLADVAGSLPQAIKKLNIDIRVVLPKYKLMNSDFKMKLITLGEFSFSYKGIDERGTIETINYQNIIYYFINHPNFDLDIIYGYREDENRFALFSKAVLELIPYINFKPDIIHLNDWHLGLVPYFLKEYYHDNLYYKDIKTILTIHNLQYQGNLVDVNLCDKPINLLKTGITYSDCVTTVSETYALEIITPENGEGLEQELIKKNPIIGIINGLDYDEYNPETDKLIKGNYNINKLNDKKLNKQFIQSYFNLPQEDVPVITLISRLVSQKGIDLIIKAFPKLMELDCQFIILGCGEDYYEKFFIEMSNKYQNKFRINCEFNSNLAMYLYAGADFFLMPSLFEPCGLTQLIAMRYGTIPIIRETGVLKDTVVVFDKNTLQGNGFGFKAKSEIDMLNVIKYALEVYDNNKVFTKIIKQAMKVRFDWKHSANKYKTIYSNLIRC